MKIIKQLSEDEFVVKMSEQDLYNDKSIIVAHDYVNFIRTMMLSTDPSVKRPLYGKYAFCANCINVRMAVQFPIRDMVKFVLPFLKKHPYCTEEHIGNNYHGESIIYFTDPIDKVCKVAIRGKLDDAPTILTQKMFSDIKEMGTQENNK